MRFAQVEEREWGVSGGCVPSPVIMGLMPTVNSRKLICSSPVLSSIVNNRSAIPQHIYQIMARRFIITRQKCTHTQPAASNRTHPGFLSRIPLWRRLRVPRGSHSLR